MTRNLTDEQKQEACVLFHERGMNLGQIATHFGCSLYALTPWLYLSRPMKEAAE